MTWSPTYISRFEEAIDSSTGPAKVMTDKGAAFIKTLGNPEGPHILVCEWVCARLARWIGLRTFEFAFLEIRVDDDIPIGHQKKALPGMAFATKSEKGLVWGGEVDILHQVRNTEDFSKLVLFDTWIRNRDRYLCPRTNFTNVFLSQENCSPGEVELVAMDHSHCLSDSTSITKRIADVARTKDDRTYGNFPAFGSFLEHRSMENSIARLAEIKKNTILEIIRELPSEWELDQELSKSLGDFLYRRAQFLGRKKPDDFIT